MSFLGILLLIVIASVAAFMSYGRARPLRERTRGAARQQALSSRRATAACVPASHHEALGDSDTGVFAGVEIHVAANACRPARALSGGIFLAAEAPPLPLEGCTQARCSCSFQKLTDRRQDRRRWCDEGLAATVYSASERRKHDDRRGSDPAG